MKECGRKTEITALAREVWEGSVSKTLDFGHGSGRSAMGSLEDRRVVILPELTWQALGVVDQPW